MKRLFTAFLLDVLLLTFGSAQSAAPAKQLSIDAIFAEGGITGRAPETIKWSPDGSKVSYVLRDDSGEHGELWYVDAATGEKKVLVSAVKLSQLAPPASRIKDEREKERVTRYHVAAYSWSPDSKHLLFDAQGQLWYYSLETGTAVQLTSSPDPSQDPKFSPDGTRLAYVRKHNLYVHPVTEEAGERPLLHAEKEKDKDKDKTLGDDILNGEVDWVYAEELAVRSNFFWSPEGRDILFLQMDESRVPTYPITDWLPTHPHVEQEKYPQPGDPNPSVRLGVASSDGRGKARWMKLTDDDDTYVPRFGWIREEWAWAEVLNRKQDVLDLYFINTKSGKTRKVLTESEPGAWVNVNDDCRILKSGDHFLWTSWRDGHTHIYLYSFNPLDPIAGEAKLERQVESGDYEVLAVNGVDPDSGTVFFTANKDDPREEKLFSIKLDGSGLQAVSSEPGHDLASFAENGKHYVETHSATLTPPAISICSAAGPCRNLGKPRDRRLRSNCAQAARVQSRGRHSAVWLSHPAREHRPQRQSSAHRLHLWRPRWPNGEGRLGRHQRTFSPDAGERGFCHLFRRQSRHTESRQKIFGGHPRTVRRRRTERPAHRARPVIRAVSAARSHAHSDVGMVEWRLDDALFADSFRPFQSRHLGGAHNESAQL